MSKESLYSQYVNLVFRETFRDEQSVRRNGGTPTDVDFSNGVGSFDGSSNYVSYNKPLNGVYSIRFRFKSFTPILNQYLIDFRNSDGSGTGYIYCNSTTSLASSTGTAYINGVVSSTISLETKEVIITGMSLNSIFWTIGRRSQTSASYITADIDLVEIYKGTLTEEEVSNLYNNTWNKELSPSNVLLDFNSSNELIELGDRADDATITDVTVKNQGAEFNGSTSKIDTGTDMIGTKAVTVMGWIKPYSYSAGTGGSRIITNDKFILSHSTRFLGYSDGSTFTSSASDVVKFNQWQFVSVTRETDGTVNFYIGDKSTAPALSGTADQDSGTPEAGATNVIIGNNDAQIRTFDGLINKLSIYESILSTDEITRYWSESLKHIKG